MDWYFVGLHLVFYKHMYSFYEKMTEQKQQLEQQLWIIANTLRGKMDADDFRDYILGFIFYKFFVIIIFL